MKNRTNRLLSGAAAVAVFAGGTVIGAATTTVTLRLNQSQTVTVNAPSGCGRLS